MTCLRWWDLSLMITLLQIFVPSVPVEEFLKSVSSIFDEGMSKSMSALMTRGIVMWFCSNALLLDLLLT